jgi:DDE superfamily endonuclease/aminotransferase class III
LLADLLGRVAGCFPRRETRQSCGQMLSGLLMELDDHNCWTIAEAVGHRGPHRLQYLLSRAVWDEQQVLDTAAGWAVSHLDDGDGVLIVDETADEKSSADAAGAARQYSGTVGGIALCQVAVTLTYATSRGHALIGRALYLPEACAGDEEHRELAAAAANATLDLYQSEQLIRRAADLGDYFRQQLDQLQERHPILGWIDARGLFIGLEFVRDRATKEPAADEAAWMLDYCVREGLLFEKGGYYYNRFQLIPPLVIEKDGIDRAITILDQAMTMAETRSGITKG